MSKSKIIDGIIVFYVLKARRPLVLKVTYQKCAASHLPSLWALSQYILARHDKVARIVGYLKKHDASSFGAAVSALSSHEFNCDIALWFCEDLMPFEAVVKDGMVDLFRKVQPNIDLPSLTTLSTSALDDVYVAVHSHIKDLLKDVKSICLMFDGWTDQYSARPYTMFYVLLSVSKIKCVYVCEVNYMVSGRLLCG